MDSHIPGGRGGADLPGAVRRGAARLGGLVHLAAYNCDRVPAAACLPALRFRFDVRLPADLLCLLAYHLGGAAVGGIILDFNLSLRD